MIFWVDGQLGPQVARWLASRCGCEAMHIQHLRLLHASDHEIHTAARAMTGVVVVSKDGDFKEIVRQRGSPPQVLWLRFGNASNARVRQILNPKIDAAVERLRQGESIVEIDDT